MNALNFIFYLGFKIYVNVAYGIYMYRSHIAYVSYALKVRHIFI
jgi:hypothetical protein